ncbi:hypothetical protein BJI67_08005 [Acidihalobacter aeolianus]|uniref:Antitoxin Xre/MbcA/ParS-like toxin-binding domain-containing protein n=2 Tax=Acidihalobacter aeolianus TaxID=2792603 RepID=A0A1D8K7Q9_9GAMM|nr:hypothetical protein BJI67_08005 [Acidihalobacter aeolianus]
MPRASRALTDGRSRDYTNQADRFGHRHHTQEIFVKQPKNSIATVASRLMKFAERPPWAQSLRGHWHAYIALAAELLDWEPEDVADELDALGLQGIAFGMIFEAFATHRDKISCSFLADYLKRVGWRESAPARQYIQTLRDSTLGLYEILEVHRDKGFLLRDLLDSDAEPQFVDERSATHHLARWDIVAARVLPVLKRRQFSGGLLPIRRETYLRVLRPEWEESRDELEARAEFFRSLPAISASLWLVDAIEQAQVPLPELRNYDGEPILPGTAQLPLRTPADSVAAVLDAAADWVRAGDDPPFWNWLGGAPDVPAAPPPEQDTGLIFQSYTDSNAPVRGGAELQANRLIFTALSAARMERGLTRLRALLGAALGEALVKYDNLQDTQARKHAEPVDISPKDDTVPPEIDASLIQEMLDRHYRAVIDQPVPMLDGLTPRQAAIDLHTRKRALEWLKALENHEDRRSARDGQTPYDTRWLWTTLGLNRNDQIR